MSTDEMLVIYDEKTEKECEDKKGKSRGSDYGKCEYLLAGIALASAWMYVKGAGVFSGLWLPLFTALFAGAGIFYLYSLGKRMDREGKCGLFIMAAAGFWFLVKYLPGKQGWEGQEITSYMVLFLHGSGVYWLITIGGARMKNLLDESFFGDLVKGFFAIPFSRFGEIFLTAASAAKKFRSGDQEEKRKRRSRAGQIAFGIIMSVPVLMIVLPMLAAADESFSVFIGGISGFCQNLTGNFFRVLIWNDLLGNLMVFFCTCYFYGLFYGAFHAKVTKDGEETRKESIGLKLPFAAMFSFSSAVCGVYALFFLVKFSDVIAKTFTGHQSFIYSAYARQGFFELCYISVINFVLFYFIKTFFNRQNRTVKAVLSLLSAETLGFIILAFSKMCLYISVYGFTFKRVFTSWFMAVLFLAFSRLLFCIWKKGNAIKTAVLFASVTFLLLAYSNMEVWMNQINQAMGFLS